MITENQKCCGNCESWKRLLEEKKYPLGVCQYTVKFPDSLFARSPGLRKEMREYDGQDCQCFNFKKIEEKHS
jgi:hypothetical protein